MSVPSLSVSRRAFLSAAMGCATLLQGWAARAADVPVPIELQVELLAKMAPYDRNFARRTEGVVRTLIVVREGSAESERVADRLAAAFENISRIGGLPHHETVTTFTTAARLRRHCESSSTDIVYLTPGLEEALPDVVAALSGLSVLSVSAVPAHVPARVVLGFDLVSGRPKMLVHLEQARSQHVEFRSDVLRLTRVYR